MGWSGPFAVSRRFLTLPTITGGLSGEQRHSMGRSRVSPRLPDLCRCSHSRQPGPGAAGRRGWRTIECPGPDLFGRNSPRGHEHRASRPGPPGHRFLLRRGRSSLGCPSRRGPLGLARLPADRRLGLFPRPARSATARGWTTRHWASLPLLGQWLWSVPFLAALGESHLALRVSTVVLSWLGLWAFYDLMRRQEGASPGVAAFAAACLAWNPYFFLLSGTFMTDVPALAFALVALAGYARRWPAEASCPWRRRRWRHWRRRPPARTPSRRPWRPGCCCSAPPTGPGRSGSLPSRCPSSPASPSTPGCATRADVVPLHAQLPDVERVVWLAFTGALYLGLMAAPLLLLVRGPRPGKVFWGSLAALAAGAASLVLAAGSSRHEGVFPYLEDVLTARGTYVTLEGAGRPPVSSWEMRLVPTVLGCVCAGRPDRPGGGPGEGYLGPPPGALLPAATGRPGDRPEVPRPLPPGAGPRRAGSRGPGFAAALEGRPGGPGSARRADRGTDARLAFLERGAVGAGPPGQRAGHRAGRNTGRHGIGRTGIRAPRRLVPDGAVTAGGERPGRYRAVFALAATQEKTIYLLKMGTPAPAGEGRSP